MHDFSLFKENDAGIAQDILCLADTGYLRIDKFHANSQIPGQEIKASSTYSGAEGRQPEISK